MCSRRRSTDQRGFTVLECEVAILVLVLLAYGLMRMVGSHEVLVSDMEGLSEDEGVWYVVQPDAELERWLGQPARTTGSSPGGSAGSNGVGGSGDAFDLHILEASYGLSPMSASATVELTVSVL